MSQVASLMAGFEVTPYGRFWVTPKGRGRDRFPERQDQIASPVTPPVHSVLSKDAAQADVDKLAVSGMKTIAVCR